MTTTDAITAYLDYLATVTRRSPQTITAYRYDLARFALFLQASAEADLAALDAPTVKRWRKHYNQARPHSALGYRPPAPAAWQPGPPRPAL